MLMQYFSAVIASHLAGQVYKPIIEKRANFSSQMSVSGPASATGKSLMQTVCMLVFTGKIQPTTTSLSEALFYEMVDEGNIYGRNIHIGLPQGNINGGGGEGVHWALEYRYARLRLKSDI